MRSALPDFSTTDVIVPTFNESSTVPELLERLRRALPGARLIFVDNASTDRTCEILEQQDDVVLIRHDRNLGYGRSLMDGLRAGRGEFVVMIDADLEYHPEDLPALVDALSRCDAVFGSRFLGRPRRPAGIALWRALGNRALNTVFNWIYGQRMTDLYTGIRGYRRDALDLDRVRRDDWAMVPEMTTALALRGGVLGEVPVEYQMRATGASKMRHASEFAKFVGLALRWRFAPSHRAGAARSAQPD
ncbi:MAG: glycosyltransferase family 2 protein [Myxococcota bacterium]